MGSIGQRSGQDVDIKYFANVNGIYDTGFTPYAVSASGQLVRPGGLFGVEAGLGAYGRHTFRRAALGLDYNGNFRHYTQASNFDGSNQQLGLSFSYQKSRRLQFGFTTSVGTQTFGTVITPSSLGAEGGLDIGTNTLLFDNRTNYQTVAFNTRYALGSRTAISMGGSEYSVHRQSSALIGVKGYTLDGSISRQLSRRTTFGVAYSHIHYDFPRAFGESDIDTFQGTWGRDIGRNWTLRLSGGLLFSAVQGVQSSALDPAIAALLGISSVSTIFYRENILPLGTVSAGRKFRRASWSASYSRGINPGNGVFLTSRQEAISSSYSYTGIRRWSLGISASSFNTDSIGQDLRAFRQLTGSATVAYKLGRTVNVVVDYARRYQDLKTSAFPRDSARTSISLYFSPGTVPVSFR